MTNPRIFLRALFDAAISAADPMRIVPAHLPAPPKGRTVALGAGKAAARMARAVETHWPGVLSGLVVTRYGHGVACERIEVIEAAHPVPDAAGETAARRILEMAQALGENDLALCLISGGASALLNLPAPGLTLAEKRNVAKILLASGADIAAINCLRKHMSAIKGGRLAAAAWPAQTVTLAISDVPGDDPAVIGSGPTVGDPAAIADARKVLDRFAPQMATRIAPLLSESVKPDDPRLAKTEYHLIATPQAMLNAAAETARRLGVHPVILGDALEGEARDLAQALAKKATQTQEPCVLLSGGETTVTIKGKGRGGRNTEFLLALALALKGHLGVSALAADTDGIDGSEDNAGAFIFPDTLARAQSLGLNPSAMLEDNNAYGFFAALQDLLITGPTRTNVNDFRAIWVMP